MDTFSDLIPFSFEWLWALLLLPTPLLIKSKQEASKTNMIAPKIPLFHTFKQINVSTGTVSDKHSKWQVIVLAIAWF